MDQSGLTERAAIIEPAVARRSTIPSLRLATNSMFPFRQIGGLSPHDNAGNALESSFGPTKSDTPESVAPKVEACWVFAAFCLNHRCHVLVIQRAVLESEYSARIKI